ncbi:hypothetical protein GCM10009749_33200 [Agromyces neolithicus]|uniref:Uncharacterized protein n=1 Tax=Agromyces neolithicus TaxID=269420 RepID=A0ABN2MCJ5_9MICO
MPLDRGDGSEHGGEPLSGRDRHRHHHEHEQRPERRHDAETASRGRPERAEQQGEYRERCKHDDQAEVRGIRTDTMLDPLSAHRQADRASVNRSQPYLVVKDRR